MIAKQSNTIFNGTAPYTEQLRSREIVHFCFGDDRESSACFVRIDFLNSLLYSPIVNVLELLIDNGLCARGDLGGVIVSHTSNRKRRRISEL